MQQFLSLLWIMLPLFVGFFIRLHKPQQLKLIEIAVNYSVYLILTVMGIGLAQMDNLGGNILRIMAYAGLFLGGTLAVNMLVMGWFDRRFPWKNHTPQDAPESRLRAFAGSLKQVGVVVLGVLIGYVLPRSWQMPEQTVSYLLMVLLLLIGIQLRSSGIALRTVLINRRGVQTALVFVLATLSGGWLAGSLLGLPASQSLALSSGFGWYSLSGSVMTQAYGAFWGAVALMNDLGRELFALICIPALMRRHPSLAVSIGGATALDFTLPVIHRSGGVNAVPLAISFSFIINLLAPILMVFFAGSSF
ncbi:MAG: lysine exporter LysO family protein [Neisseria sp.]|nr:lysine exporter LysO family protein [Neisseria sp.]